MKEEAMILRLHQIFVVSRIAAGHALNTSHALQIFQLLNFDFGQVNVRYFPFEFGDGLVFEAFSEK